MEERSQRSASKNRRRFLHGSTSIVAMTSCVLVVPILCLRSVEGFWPAAIRQQPTRTTSPFPSSGALSRVSLASSPPTPEAPTTTNSEGHSDDKEVEAEANVALHQQMKEIDPEWYQAYVSDILGEEYVANRWSSTTTVEDDSSAASLVEPESTEETKDLPNGEEKVYEPVLTTETPDIAEEEEEEEKLEPELEPTAALEESISTIETTTEALDETPKPLDQQEEKDTETPSIQGTATESVETDAEAIPVAKDDDARALVYRNITGQTLTYVPLANLLALGYQVSDLETIQAEFLSIVVLDQRPCPSMGVPAQWKIKGNKPEVTLVDSSEEASAMVGRINEEERRERDSIQKRRRRQEDRQQQQPQQPQREGRRSTPENASRSRPRDRDLDRRPPAGRGSRPPENRGEGRRRRRGEERGAQRQRVKRPPGWDVEELSRVPRGSNVPYLAHTRENDPPPPSKFWIDMNTFRDLLEGEAALRTNILGDDWVWSEAIEQEHNWRTSVYQKWLWLLNNGVGESVVPPSRSQRFRDANRTPRRRPTNPDPPRRNRRMDNDDDEDDLPPPRPRRPPPEGRRRRPRRPRSPYDDDYEDDVTAAKRRRAAAQQRKRERDERWKNLPGR